MKRALFIISTQQEDLLLEGRRATQGLLEERSLLIHTAASAAMEAAVSLERILQRWTGQHLIWQGMLQRILLQQALQISARCSLLMQSAWQIQYQSS